MKTTERYDMRSGQERVTFHRPATCDQVLIIASGGIRFWYTESGDLILPPADYSSGQVCNVNSGKTFCFAAIEPKTVVYHAW